MLSRRGSTSDNDYLPPDGPYCIHHDGVMPIGSEEGVCIICKRYICTNCRDKRAQTPKKRGKYFTPKDPDSCRQPE